VAGGTFLDHNAPVEMIICFTVAVLIFLSAVFRA
jgi:hypothetical protein